MINLMHGDCLEVLKTLEENSIDSIVTDPPYGLAFMGNKWDYDVPSVEIWKECLRVLKPGGHLLSFGGTSRFFYCAKASKSERGESNTHPTVKPIKLMTYLIKLITHPGGIVLDPFMGSGSTGKAARDLGFGFVGIEREESYFKIAEARIVGHNTSNI